MPPSPSPGSSALAGSLSPIPDGQSFLSQGLQTRTLYCRVPGVHVLSPSVDRQIQLLLRRDGRGRRGLEVGHRGLHTLQMRPGHERGAERSPSRLGPFFAGRVRDLERARFSRVADHEVLEPVDALEPASSRPAVVRAVGEPRLRGICTWQPRRRRDGPADDSERVAAAPPSRTHTDPERRRARFDRASRAVSRARAARVPMTTRLSSPFSSTNRSRRPRRPARRSFGSIRATPSCGERGAARSACPGRAARRGLRAVVPRLRAVRSREARRVSANSCLQST